MVDEVSNTATVVVANTDPVANTVVPAVANTDPVVVANTAPAVDSTDTDTDGILSDIEAAMSRVETFFSKTVYGELASFWVRVRNVFTNELSEATAEAHTLIADLEDVFDDIKAKL
jgi:hypothetical protein